MSQYLNTDALPKMYLVITGRNIFGVAMAHADRGESCSEESGHMGHVIRQHV